MKKIFTLCLALFCATATFAQNDEDFNPKGSFVFTDKDGNVYEDMILEAANPKIDTKVFTPEEVAELPVKVIGKVLYARRDFD